MLQFFIGGRDISRTYTFLQGWHWLDEHGFDKSCAAINTPENSL